MQIADMICGNFPDESTFFPYRKSSLLTEFFRDIDTNYTHDGTTTRQHWVADRLEEILQEPHAGAGKVPPTFARVIQRLMDSAEAINEDHQRPAALATLNAALVREGFEAYYAPDKQCYLRHIATNTTTLEHNPHRPLSAAEIERRDQLRAYLEKASEDELIEEILLPLFRQMGFHRVTAAGHKDKALEYGKDVWMKFTLPTQHVLYFGLQAKKGKLDASGTSRAGNANVAEIYNQVLMMLSHEIFDPEFGKRVLVDHAFIVAGGEITKQARNWLAHALDAAQRRSIIFMDRNDILDLFVVNNLPLPAAALPPQTWPDEPPF
ncbi:hypothetical protein AB0G12_40010 [Nonomuraea dietziae]